MLTLRRVRLVNWHYFHDETIHLGSTTLIAGDNGSGKSTIIDAIQYALIADIRKIRFNAAAAEIRTERTLEGYCRCKIGATGLEYYRGNTITHVILEFTNSQKSFLAGVQIESIVNEGLKEQFWVMEHGKLEDIQVQDHSHMVTMKAFRNTITAKSGRVCRTKSEYSSRLTQLLHVHRRNVSFNPYFEALVRSVSFKPLHSVDRFVCDYILEERQVDISAMKENLFNYKEAEREALAMEQKIDQLEIIEKMQNRAGELETHLIRQEYLERRLPVEIIHLQLKDNRTGQERRDRELASVQHTIERDEALKRKYQYRLEETRDALRNNDEHRMYQQFLHEKSELVEKLQIDTRDIEEYRLLASQVEALIERTLAEDLTEELQHISVENRELLKRQIEKEHEIQQFDTERKELKVEEKEVTQGVLRYPENTMYLLEALKKEHIEAYIFADLLEIEREEWQNAIEGWLNTQRCNILVEEHDFLKAIEIYDALPKHVSGVGLPHLAKMKNSEIRPGSLAELVEAKSPLARRYNAHLLGDVMMVSLEHLKDYAKSVTRECMKYSNKTVSRIRESVCNRWYIGKSAKQKRLAAIRERVSELDKLLGSAKSQLEQTYEAVEIGDRAAKSIQRLITLRDSFESEKYHRELLQDVEKQLSQIDTSGFSELKQIVETITQQISALEHNLSKAQRETGILENKLEQLELSYIELQHNRERSENDYTGYISQHEDMEIACEQYYLKHIPEHAELELLMGKLASMGTAKKGTQTKIFDVQKQLRSEKEQYNRAYNTFMTIEGDASQQFLDTLESYKLTELPQYREKITHARLDAEKQFKEHFVSRLNEYLTNAKESFSELNSILRKLTFGQDQYSFSLSQKQEKKYLLSVISEAAQIREYEGTLFDQLVDEEQKNSIETLFSSILEHDLDSIEVREICDYRMYYTYDIKIKHTETFDEKTGKVLESSLSRSLREKSGGETQTPYYVAIAASFFRFFKDDDEAVRLVLFDEAFNKMDDDRIANMLNFFKQMGIQVLTAVPTEKIEIIAPHVDRVNLILRKDYHAFVRDYKIAAEKSI